MSFFGINIKKIRHVKGLSQKAFADLFDLNRGVISSYEEGRAEPKIETILKVADHFGIELDELLTKELQNNQLNNISAINQLLLFPEPPLQNTTANKGQPENNIPNAIVLQKILASVDLIHEFTKESHLLPQYQYGDILFLKKADPEKASHNSLVIYNEDNIQYLTENQKTKENIYKIIGHISTTEKNIFESIFERLENLENQLKKSQY
ncbi:helix-turn-helix transcriptional regulator [Chryseobacterium sp.]|uniref:helix-turn-helix domain-containing protein n=1 Tax=Chryseobacterium sp. TaxID=1871047 RepID=UPI0025C6EDA0|nr:helix-turn-helix transcriptional regulator [Chryseobacterium sp.]MBV8327145.1 helix-turn-helix transcriptional regulator [Chryseobacterium sp.]